MINRGGWGLLIALGTVVAAGVGSRVWMLHGRTGASPSSPASRPADTQFPDGDDEAALAEAIRLIELHYIRPVDRRELLDAGLDGIGATLDKYSGYIRQKDVARAKASLEQELGRSGSVRGERNEAEVRLETVCGVSRNDDDSWNYLVDGPGGIAYVRVAYFGRDTAGDFRRVLVELRRHQIRGLVLDLRINPGGLLASAVEVCDLFLSGQTIVTIEGRNVPRESWQARAEGTFDTFPMAVLVNGQTASASEIVAAALQDHRRAVVVGERTAGKASVQQVIELAGGTGALKLTIANYIRPSGRRIARLEDAGDDTWGVTPDAGFAVTLTTQETNDLGKGYRSRTIRRAVVRATEPNDHPAVEAEAVEAAVNTTSAVDRQLRCAIDYLRGP